MKAISPALRAHLAQAATTITTCWLLARTDGAQFGFTSFDRDLVVSGMTYKSTQGFSRSAIVTNSTPQVDNVEVVGYFSPGGITERDLQNGLYNYASVFLFALNWADPTMGVIKLRRGWLGECVRNKSGTFTAELRGLTQALVQEFGDVYSPLCRADLGDTQCKVPILPAAWTASATYADTTGYCSPATQPTDALKTAIFQLTTPGSSGAAEPAWNTAIGAVTPDGTAAWTARAPFRLIGSVLAASTQHQFFPTSLASPLPAPAATGEITFNEYVSAGTSIEVTDGLVTASATFPSVILGRDACYQMLQALTHSGLRMVFGNPTPVNITLANNSGSQASIVVRGDTGSDITVTQFPGDYFANGTVTWLSGQNSGASMEIKTFVPEANLLVLWLAAPYPIVAGDRFWYYPGCDKRRDTCLLKYNNIINNRSEPDMPGQDKMYGYETS